MTRRFREEKGSLDPHCRPQICTLILPCILIIIIIIITTNTLHWSQFSASSPRLGSSPPLVPVLSQLSSAWQLSSTGPSSQPALLGLAALLRWSHFSASSPRLGSSPPLVPVLSQLSLAWQLSSTGPSSHSPLVFLGSLRS